MRALNTLENFDYKNEVASQNLFELPRNLRTLDKYSRIWEQFLCYMLRTAPIKRLDDEAETGVTFSQDQWLAIDILRGTLEADAFVERVKGYFMNKNIYGWVDMYIFGGVIYASKLTPVPSVIVYGRKPRLL
jgi:hypothetical protein